VNETVLAQHAQVAADGWAADVEAPGDRAGGHRAVVQHDEDVAPHLVGDRTGHVAGHVSRHGQKRNRLVTHRVARNGLRAIEPSFRLTSLGVTCPPMAQTTSGPAVGRREARRLQHQDLSRAQLLDAAEEVFGRKGFHQATLKEVAELAEFSVGSVYSFFENKDDLFRQIFRRRGDEFMPGLRDALRDEGTPTEQLHRLVEYEIGFFRRNPRFGRLYLRYSSATMISDDREVDAATADHYEETMRLQADLFARGQRAGDFRPGDPAVLARLFSGLMSSYQALDPAVMSDPAEGERLPLADLHDLVQRTFAT
jgi:TetR/AcrR family transcriptional regulator